MTDKDNGLVDLEAEGWTKEQLNRYPFQFPIDGYYYDESDHAGYIVMAAHHTAYEAKEAPLPGSFVCVCDHENVARIITDLLNDLEDKGYKA